MEPRTEPTAAEVERRVRQAIAEVADLHARSIRATTNSTIVHLHGHLPSVAALETAVHAAEITPGVTAVESAIVVTP